MLANFSTSQRLPPSLPESVSRDDLLADILDVIPAAALIVNRDLRILHANAEARAMLRIGTPIFAHQRQLRPTCKTVLDKMRKAVSRANDVSFPLPACDGRIAIAHIKMMAAHAHPERLATHAAVLISHSASPRNVPVDALAELFALTPSETKVLAYVITGNKRRQTAAALGLSDATVATHLRNIFIKTGAQDRFALCQMATTLSWPAVRQSSLL